MRPHRSPEPTTFHRRGGNKPVAHDPFDAAPIRKGSLEERDAKERAVQDSTVLAWTLGLIAVLGFVLGLNGMGGGWILVLLVASIAVSQITPPKR